jgi:hypothetical protein
LFNRFSTEFSSGTVSFDVAALDAIGLLAVTTVLAYRMRPGHN